MFEVKVARMSKGMTQSELSRESGICRTKLSRIENDNFKGLNYENMIILSEILEVSVSDLFFKKLN